MAQPTRKLTAIVAMDVVGYSRLMGNDESGTHARLKALRSKLIEPAIARHNGRLFKLVGDGVLVDFPSAVEALSAAIEIQQAAAEEQKSTLERHPLLLRIGLHLGDVLVDGEDLYGDGVNLAVRLEAAAPVGGILVSRSIHDAVGRRLKASFEDAGKLSLKNIRQPVEAFTVRWKSSDWSTLSSNVVELPPTAPRAPTDVPTILSDKPSVAVLPFRNLSGDVEQDYFADGMVTEIITALSRFKSLLVISRNSSFTYRDSSVDINKVGRELGVRYVLEGSVRKSGERIRIAGQLINCEAGTHLWAERFDGSLDDVFELQDRVATSVACELVPQLRVAEIDRAKRKPTDSLHAYDHYLRALANTYKWTKSAHEAALPMLYEAIRLDANFAAAYALAGMCYTLRKQSRWMTDVEAESAEATRLSRRAIELASDDDPWSLAVAGFNLAYVAEELEVGADLIERGLVLNQNFALGWHFSGWVKIYLGEPEVALEHLERSLRLSPRDPNVMQMKTAVAFASFFAGRYEDAMQLARKAVGEVPSFLPAWRMIAISSALSGQLDHAKAAAARVLEIDATARTSTLVPLLPLRRPQDRERYREGLLRAGIPE